MTQSFQAATAEEMIEAGRRFAASLESGDVVGLNGDLGAGKTHFCKGLVAGLGGSDEVTSPTFALVHEYKSGRLPLFHFDWYRLDSSIELDTLGWDDYLDEEGVVVVEWSDKFPGMLPPRRFELRFEIAPDGVRRVHVSRP